MVVSVDYYSELESKINNNYLKFINKIRVKLILKLTFIFYGEFRSSELNSRYDLENTIKYQIQRKLTFFGFTNDTKLFITISINPFASI